MRLKTLSLSLLTFIFVIALTGCDSSQEPNMSSSHENTSQTANTANNQAASKKIEAPKQICSNCGSIINIEPVTTKGESSGAGAVIGGVVGGLLGNQVGGGTGKKVATVVGAVGGAVAGNEIEKNKNAVTYYAVTVKMEDGTQRVVNVGSSQGISIGTKVKVIDNDLQVL